MATESPVPTPVPTPVGAVATPEHTSRWKRLPVVHQLRTSVGLQRGMLVAGLVLCVVFLVVALLAPVLAPYGWAQLRADGELFGAHVEPNADHLLGTTVAGYDVLSRVVWGARTALYTIVIGVAASIVIGVVLGLVSGYFGGWLDRVLVVVSDAIYAFPSLLLAILAAIVISAGQSSMWGGVIATAVSITVVFIPQYFRVVRAEVVRVKGEAFVESARVVGSGHVRIMTRHVLRNAVRTLPLIVTLNACEAVLTLAGLGFLGFGIEPTAAGDWGYDLHKALADVTSGIWWTAIPPGVAIVLTALGVTLVGESLNDLADPRLRTRRRKALVAGEVGQTVAVPGGVLAAGPEGVGGLDALEGPPPDVVPEPEDGPAEEPAEEKDR